MEKSIVAKIKALQNNAASQEEFMKKLAEVDENGQLTADMQATVNGGAVTRAQVGGVSPLEPPVYGMWNPDPALFNPTA